MHMCFFDFFHSEGAVVYDIHNLLCIITVFEVYLFAVCTVEFCSEFFLILDKMSINTPVFLRYKLIYFILSVTE